MRSTMEERITEDTHLPVFLRDPEGVMAEISRLLEPIVTAEQLRLLSRADQWVRALFNGTFPGYRACNTPYHDIEHTYAVALAAARIVCGRHAHASAPERGAEALEAYLMVIAALFHDTGYLQDEHDTHGTGAKHTVGHEARSARLATRFLREHGASRKEQELCSHAVAHGVPGGDEEETTAGRLAIYLTYADLFSQMADRAYLERLLLLYQEFREAGIPGFEHERDVLSGTRAFYQSVTSGAAEAAASSVSEMLAAHFKQEYGRPEDLYGSYIARNIAYLDVLIRNNWDSYRRYLRRAGVVRSLQNRRNPVRGFTTRADGS